jgi:hypothetical protein
MAEMPASTRHDNSHSNLRLTKVYYLNTFKVQNRNNASQWTLPSSFGLNEKIYRLDWVQVIWPCFNFWGSRPKTYEQTAHNCLKINPGRRHPWTFVGNWVPTSVGSTGGKMGSKHRKQETRFLSWLRAVFDAPVRVSFPLQRRLHWNTDTNMASDTKEKSSSINVSNGAASFWMHSWSGFRTEVSSECDSSHRRNFTIVGPLHKNFHDNWTGKRITSPSGFLAHLNRVSSHFLIGEQFAVAADTHPICLASLRKCSPNNMSSFPPYIWLNIWKLVHRMWMLGPRNMGEH